MRTAATLCVAVLLGACSGGGAQTADATATVEAPPASTAGRRPSVLTGAEARERKSATIKIAAASDLRGVMAVLRPELDRACETKTTFVFGSSGQLATQIAAGADFGLYLSADAQYVADLERQGLVVPNGSASYGVGRIVIATRAGLPPVTQLRDLARPDVRTIAIANPGHAPYGRAAEQAMRSAGVYEAVHGRLVLGENIRQATDYVEQGNADVGIVAHALVVKGSPAQFTLIDASQHLPIQQAGAAIRGTGAELTARCLLQYLLDAPGQAALQDFGFEPPVAR